MFRPLFCPLGVLCVVSAVQGITIQLDYRYDTNGFFDQPGAKEALRAVADFYEERIEDNLLRIDPSEFTGSNTWTALFFRPDTGGQEEIVDLVVPEDTIIVFAGGRDFGALGVGGPGGYRATSSINNAAWFERLRERGQPGAGTSPETDIAIWGGVIAFDTNLGGGDTWNFSVEGPQSPDSTIDFVSTALHELGHLLGIGTADSWEALIDSNDFFHGPRAVESFGGPVPVQAALPPTPGNPDPGHGHWQDDQACQFPDGYDPANPLNVLSLSYGSFGKSHAVDQIARMDPAGCRIPDRETMQVMTDLDLAALRDIGWEVRMPQRLETLTLGPGGSSFEWPSSTGETYVIQRSLDLSAGWSDASSVVAGDGLVMSFTDPSPPSDRAFYRLSDTSASAPTASMTVFSASAPSSKSVDRESKEGPVSIEKAPRMVPECGGCAHH